MKIRGKLLTGYFLVALLTAVVGWFGMRIVNTVSEEFKRQAEDEIPLGRSLQELKYAGLRIVSSTVEYGFLWQQGDRELFQGELAEEKKLIAEGVSSYYKALGRYEKDLMRHHHGVRDRGHDRINESGEALIETAAAIVSALEKSRPARQLVELKEKNEKAERQFLQAIERESRENASDFAEIKQFTYRTMQGALQNIVMVTGATFALALLSGMVISASFSRRLRTLQNAVRKMGEGDLKAAIHIGPDDEIGALAESFQGMAQALHRSTHEIIAGKDYFSEVIHSMMDALIVVSPDGAIQQVNGAACAMLGYDDEPVGRPLKEVLPDCSLEELVNRGYLSDEERTLVARDGRKIPVALSISIIWNPDNSMRSLVCVAHDITGRKEWEAMQRRYNRELKDSNDELRGFVYTISHDLRTPLVNIRGFAGELVDNLKELAAVLEEAMPHVGEAAGVRMAEIVRSEVPEALHFITDSVRKMDGMLSSVLRLSHLGQRKMTVEPVNVSELVNGIRARLGKTIDGAEVEVIIGDLPDLETDRAALEEIMGGLLDNAVKYRAPGRRARIEVSAENSDEGWLFHVRDNGIGISEEDIGKIFDPFRRAGQQESTGEGMGLAYVRALVKQCHGRIWCSSEVGTGSTFSFTIGEEWLTTAWGGRV
ncbi:sensor histidine kinase [Geotalea toluenoxydans]